jgi:hypothetical protein
MEDGDVNDGIPDDFDYNVEDSGDDNLTQYQVTESNNRAATPSTPKPKETLKRRKKEVETTGASRSSRNVKARATATDAFDRRTSPLENIDPKDPYKACLPRTSLQDQRASCSQLPQRLRRTPPRQCIQARR